MTNQIKTTLRHKLTIPEEYLPLLPSIAEYANGKEVLIEAYKGDYADVICCMSCFTVKVEWLSKPPQKSAFQAWDSGTGHSKSDGITDHRKRGWNAAIDKVIEICISIPGFPGGERFEKIDSLKEP